MPEVKQNPLIQTVNEQAIVEQVPPEPTLEEKIATNYYKCDTETQWIRADNAQCINKYKTTQTTKTRTRSAENASNGWYPRYSCTGHVASKRQVGQWHDAVTWPTMAKADGWYVGPTPVAGAIGYRSSHVVYVERVEGNQVYISERNYDYNGSYREMWRPIDYFTYIY